VQGLFAYQKSCLHPSLLKVTAKLGRVARSLYHCAAQHAGALVGERNLKRPENVIQKEQVMRRGPFPRRAEEEEMMQPRAA